jgi:hypothetical protein
MDVESRRKITYVPRPAFPGPGTYPPQPLPPYRTHPILMRGALGVVSHLMFLPTCMASPHILFSCLCVCGAVEDVRCNLYWERDTCLLIGWFDSVMLLEIKGGAGGRQIGTVMEFKVGPDQDTNTQETQMEMCMYHRGDRGR